MNTTIKVDEDFIPVIKEYPGFGELTTGSSDPNRILFTALSMLNNPLINQFLLDCKLKLKDRMTGTAIFPREGMDLLDGAVYSAPVENAVAPAKENV